jgi:hyperosmotically inducible protein
VKNALQVVPTAQQQVVAKSDADVKAALEERIQKRQELANTEIDVDVNNGVARLSGRVKTQADRLAALVVARTTTGVRGGVDNLRVEEQDVSAG